LKNFKLKAETGECSIFFESSLKELEKYSKNRKTVILTDINVNNYYGKFFESFPVIVINTGEKVKTIDTVKDIYEKFLDLEMDRNSFVIGAGGGIVCDITGFAASTFMRGIPFAFVPTTLLAQVDAAIGGKNGVNFKGYKNIVGTFNQPEFILYDFNLLKTLPQKELFCGLAEMVKHGAIESFSYFEFLEEKSDKILSLHMDTIEKTVCSSIKIKTKIVESDELEKGERKKLNFGHTFGHAIEKITGRSHGEAVSAGMVMACRYSVKKGLLKKKDGERLKKLLRKFNLPLEVDINKEKLYEAIKKDKKRDSRYIDFVVLEKIGKARILPVKIEELIEILEE